MSGEIRSDAPSRVTAEGAQMTAGPWRVNPEQRNPWVVEYPAADEPGGYRTVCKVGREADARMIVASWSMRQALRGIEKDAWDGQFASCAGKTRVFERIHAAAVRALGRVTR